MSEDPQTEVTSEEGNQIPVRYEGNYPTYTDEYGRHLSTGEYIGPGSTLVGEDYEHNPEKAHMMANVEKPVQDVVLHQKKSAEGYEELAETAETEHNQERLSDLAASKYDEAAQSRWVAGEVSDKAGNMYDELKGKAGQPQSERVRPNFEKHFEDQDGFLFLGHVDVGIEGHKGDAYIHDRSRIHPDWPKLSAVAIAVRRGDEESNYSYSRLDVFAGADGYELYTKGFPVFGQEGVRVKSYDHEALKMAMDKGLITEDDILKSVDCFDVKRMDPAIQQRVIEVNGYKTLDEWKADEEAKYMAAREAEAKAKGYASVEELEHAEHEEFNRMLEEGTLGEDMRRR